MNSLPLDIEKMILRMKEEFELYELRKEHLISYKSSLNQINKINLVYSEYFSSYQQTQCSNAMYCEHNTDMIVFETCICKSCGNYECYYKHKDSHYKGLKNKHHICKCKRSPRVINLDFEKFYESLEF